MESQEDKFTPEMVSAYFVRWLSSFGKTDPNDERGAHFAQDNDAALFEVGCYMFFYFDVMLAKNHQHLRDKYGRVLFVELASVFSQAFQDQEIGGLIQDRINNYYGLFRTNEDATVYHFYLYQLIMRARGNLKPQQYKFREEPVTIYGADEEFEMKIGFIAWAKEFLAALERLNQALKTMHDQGEN